MSAFAVGPAAAQPCTKCGEIKPMEDFYKDPRKSGSRRAACKGCIRPAAREYQRQRRAKETVK